MQLNRSLGRHWSMGLQFQLSSGYPYSSPTHWLPTYTEDFFDAAPLDFIPRFDQPNNQRFPVYHRLDLSLERNWFVWKGTLTGRLSILNLYNRKNHFYNAYTYEYYSYTKENEKTKVKQIPNFPILPTVYLVYSF